RIELKISGCEKTAEAGRLASDAENEISIFGNGSSYSLEFTADEEGNATITFFDLSGRMLRQDLIQYTQGINHFDLPKVGSGLFLVQVKAASWSATEKIIFH
ncbi:MAG: T9SS type A sorting domain-containing protein, partial [Chitinophagales bacterium]|nr:T9SS type A sorting domain-containing protein [Chitinophagales bacterium]